MRIKFIQKTIDLFRRKKHKIDGYLSQLANKILQLESFNDGIDTLILGSSHAQLGYRAENNEFNLGLSFQDLYYSYSLYKKYCHMPVKNIILFYSVFSSGAQTIKTNYTSIAPIYKIVTGIDYQDYKTAKEKKLFSKEASFAKQFKMYKKTFSADIAYRGNEVTYETAIKAEQASYRALPHLKNNQRNNNQTSYVEEIYKLSSTHNAKLYVVISPATKQYKECLPPSEILFKDITKLQETLNIKVFNMYDCEQFNDDDFKDWDHLNINGAKKLTALIKENMP